MMACLACLLNRLCSNVGDLAGPGSLLFRCRMAGAALILQQCWRPCRARSCYCNSAGLGMVAALAVQQRWGTLQRQAVSIAGIQYCGRPALVACHCRPAGDSWSLPVLSNLL